MIPRIYAFQLGILGYWGEWHPGARSSMDHRNDIAN